MSQLATVRFAERIDRFVKGQVIVGEWCALIASGLLQDQFVWLSLEGWGLRTQCGAGKEPDGKCDLLVTCRVLPPRPFAF